MGTSRPVLFLLTLPLGTASLFAVQADVHVYDFLAIKALVARGHISGVGRQIGVGKESDIFEVRLAACCKRSCVVV
jgi:RIO-like serine/threonine protein kinase